jgi:hypothetical protein
MLETGEIDALFTANVPQPALDGSPHVKRLFGDSEPVERDYFRRTGIFPMMHTIVVKRALLDVDPTLAGRVYRAFLSAKDVAAERYRQGRRLYEVHNTVPWMNALFEENRALFADDWFPLRHVGEPHRDRHQSALPPRARLVVTALDGGSGLRLRAGRLRH